MVHTFWVERRVASPEVEVGVDVGWQQGHLGRSCRGSRMLARVRKLGPTSTG